MELSAAETHLLEDELTTYKSEAGYLDVRRGELILSQFKPSKVTIAISE